MNNKQKYLIVVCGPTAVGKTKVAIELARHFKTDIISADSRQFYREMSIGTAKPDKEELAAAKHHFINNLSIHDTYSSGQFEEEALEKTAKLFQKHDQLILAGGSGLFIKALCEGFDEYPEVPKELRVALNQKLNLVGLQSLQEDLKGKDPEYFSKVDIHNPQRVIRALEIIYTTGKTFTSFQNQPKQKRPFKTIYIGLHMDRALLYERINKRVDLMIESGLMDEIRELYKHRSLNALQTVGYAELFDYLDGNKTKEEAIALIKQNSRRYAKRQLTWFRKIEGIKWFEPTAIEQIIEHIETEVKESGTETIL